MYGLGLRPKDHIASLQRSDFGMSTWACLARVQIAAEILYWPYEPELHFQASADNDFWRMDSATQERRHSCPGGNRGHFHCFPVSASCAKCPGLASGREYTIFRLPTLS